MYIESIKFKRHEDSQWEEGYYIGDTDNSNKSIMVDRNFNELKKDKDGCRCYDYRVTGDICIQFPSK